MGEHHPAVAQPDADADSQSDPIRFADGIGHTGRVARFDVRVSDCVADRVGQHVPETVNSRNKERRSPERRPNSDGGL